MRKTIYVIDVLDTPVKFFEQRFRRFLSLEELELDWELVDGVNDSRTVAGLLEKQPAGIVISGSVHGVYEEPVWQQALERLIQGAYHTSVPLLGICFGHQLLAHALGGRVKKGPGWEFGVVPIFLYPGAEHPCFEQFTTATLAVQTHQDYVVELPPGAKALAFSRQAAFQSFSIGSCLGIQFHPEYTHEDMQALAIQRIQRFLDSEAFQNEAHVRAYADAMLHADHARIVLRNFLTAPERLRELGAQQPQLRSAA